LSNPLNYSPRFSLGIAGIYYGIEFL